MTPEETANVRRALRFLRTRPALHFGFYNLVRVHLSLRVTPAMAAGVSPTVWSMGELVEEALSREAQS